MKPTVHFPTRSLSRRVETIMSQQHQRKTADGIVPGVCDHSCPQSSAKQREHAKHSAIRGDQQHSRDSLVTMRAPKHQRGEHYADPDSSQNPAEMLSTRNSIISRPVTGASFWVTSPIFCGSMCDPEIFTSASPSTASTMTAPAQ